MAFREVSVNEIREVLRLWLGVAGLPAPGLRTIAAHCGLDRKTVRRYVEAAQAAGLRRDDDVSALDDALIGMVAEAVRPVRPDGHGAAWEQLLGFEERIRKWVAGTDGQRPLTVTKIHTLLARQGCVVPYRTLHRFACERCGFGRKDTTVRVADGDPGVECQIDFGYLGMLTAVGAHTIQVRTGMYADQIDLTQTHPAETTLDSIVDMPAWLTRNEHQH